MLPYLLLLLMEKFIQVNQKAEMEGQWGMQASASTVT